jgi:hypothetical protein
MIQPRAFAGISDKTVTNQWADAETSVISSIASSSNAPVQSLLDIIWMMESDMCKSVPAEVKAPDEKTMQRAGETGPVKLLNDALAFLESKSFPIFFTNKVVGNLLSAVNSLDKDSYLANVTRVGVFADDSLTAYTETKSPLVMLLGYFLPQNQMSGFHGDSSTSDDSGVVTAIKTLDGLSPDFRPYHMLTLLTSHKPEAISRFFDKTTTMWNTMVPLVTTSGEHGMDCTAAKDVTVDNPYYLFRGEAPRTAHSLVAFDASVGKNPYHNIKGGFGLHKVFFQLTKSASDLVLLTWLPPDYQAQLTKGGFPGFSGGRGDMKELFALDYVKGLSLFSAAAYRGFLAVCSLIDPDSRAPPKKEKEGAPKRSQVQNLVQNCASKSGLEKVFHNEDVITTLLTVTPNRYNPFEPLRGFVTQNMRGFSFWGLGEEESGALFNAQEEEWGVEPEEP